MVSIRRIPYDLPILEPGTSVRWPFNRLETVTNWQLFGFSVLWVLVGGLLLQFVVLPYLFPFAHGGHGLIAGLDSVGFHIGAADQAEKIRHLGWRAWEVNSDGDYPVALASALYAVTYLEPWVVLPVNAILFGIVIVVVRRLLTVLVDSAAVALLALAPFLCFPSFVPIWGQLHRDLITGAGFSVVLCALVLVAKRGPGSTSLRECAVMAALGMALMWLSRSYAMALVAGGTAAFVALAFLGRDCPRGRLSVVAAIVLLIASPIIGGWTRPRVSVASLIPQASVPPVETPTVEPSWPSLSWSLLRLPRTRHVDKRLPRFSSCLPEPTTDVSDRLLFNLCTIREGFVFDALRFQAGSGYDYDVRLRSAEDFIAYGPRAIGIALLEPGPKRWGQQKESPIGRLGTFLVPLEMSAAYVTFVLALVFGGRWRTRLEIWGVIAFCVTYTLFYVFAVPQFGTLYRMRAFAFTIIISTALAVVLANKTGVGKDPGV